MKGSYGRHMHRPKPAAVALILATALLWPRTARSQDTTARGRAVLVGVVRDSAGHAVPGALIVVRGRQTQTNALGAFQLSPVPAGTTTLFARHIGYAPLSLQVTLFDGDTLTTRITMARIVTLDSVDVIAQRGIEEFEERRASGAGTYITREELAKHPSWRLPDFLSRVPGMRVGGSRSSGTAYALQGRLSGSTCYSLVYLDNVPVYFPGQPLFNLHTIPPQDIEGIEYYRGGASTPAKYNRMGGGCGVLVIWTRRY